MFLNTIVGVKGDNSVHVWDKIAEPCVCPGSLLKAVSAPATVCVALAQKRGDARAACLRPSGECQMLVQALGFSCSRGSELGIVADGSPWQLEAEA